MCFAITCHYGRMTWIFTCYFGNKCVCVGGGGGAVNTKISKWRKTILPPLDPETFDHESIALTTELSPPPWLFAHVDHCMGLDCTHRKRVCTERPTVGEEQNSLVALRNGSGAGLFGLSIYQLSYLGPIKCELPGGYIHFEEGINHLTQMSNGKALINI